MKTAIVNGKRRNIKYKTSTDLYLRAYNIKSGKAANYSADIYTIEGCEGKILVAKSESGSDLTGTATYVSDEEYASIAELHSAYNSIDFHKAIMCRLGFEL